MKTVAVTMRVDPQLKAEAEFLCEQMGLTLSTAYTMFLKALVRKGAIPFKVKADSFYSEANQRHLKEAIARVEAGLGEEHELIEDNLG